MARDYLRQPSAGGDNFYTDYILQRLNRYVGTCQPFPWSQNPQAYSSIIFRQPASSLRLIRVFWLPLYVLNCILTNIPVNLTIGEVRV